MPCAPHLQTISSKADIPAPHKLIVSARAPSKHVALSGVQPNEIHRRIRLSPTEFQSQDKDLETLSCLLSSPFAPLTWQRRSYSWRDWSAPNFLETKWNRMLSRRVENNNGSRPMGLRWPKPRPKGLVVLWVYLKYDRHRARDITFAFKNKHLYLLVCSP